MGFNKKFFTTGGIVASTPPAAAGLDPLQNFETVTYTGNGGTQKITGYIRKGAAFNGSSSVIDLGDHNVFSPSVNALSVSCWINTTSTVNYIFSKGGVGAYEYGLSVNSSGQIELVAYTLSASSSVLINTSTAYNDGNWHHIVAVYDPSGNFKIYVDGSQQATSSSTLSMGNSSNPLILGKKFDANVEFNGKLDQVRIFNRALDETTDGEVTTLYNETYDSSTKSTTDIFGDGSGVALYELDEDANDTGTTPYGTGAIDSGQSAVFNGSSSKIDLPLTTLGDNPFTISLWVNFNSVGSGSTEQYIFTKYDNAPSGQYGMLCQKQANADTISFTAYNTSNGTYGSVTTTTAMTAGTWYNYILVFDAGSSITVYLNGSQEDTTSTSGTFGQNDDVLRLGAYWTGSAYLNGKIDQVRIYSSALLASDVEALASETNVPTANLIAHYKLDGNANDETTNYNGTWGGTEAYSDPAEFPLIAYNGTPTNVDFLGMAFQPDLVWVKGRSNGTFHILQDSVRTAGNGKSLYSNSNVSEGFYDADGYIDSLDTNGFTVAGGASTDLQTNGSGRDYVAWCWKAGGTVSADNNSDGDITSTVSANQDAGFSIVKYTGNNSYGQTVGHGLNTAPELVIIKNLDNARNWRTYAEPLGATKYLNLDESAAAGTYGSFNDTAPTTTVFSTTSSVADRATNFDGDNYIAYCFHSVDGYQKIGSYTGNGDGSYNDSSVAKSIDIGFRPRFVVIKRTDSAEQWEVFDSERKNTNPNYGDFNRLNFNLADAEVSSYSNYWNIVDFTDTGFDLGQDPSQRVNLNNAEYLYWAIA